MGKLFLFLSFFLCFGLTTSVIVPCYWKHLIYLPDLIKKYEEQSQLPDEMVIVISEFLKIDINKFNELMTKKNRFPIKIILIDGISYAGQNRNIGSNNAIGEILVFNDADNIPDIKRIEYINYYFENYEIDLLLHSYNFNLKSLDIIYKSNPELKGIIDDKNYELKSFNNIKIEYLIDFKNIFNGIRYHFGNCALTKKLYNQFKFPNSRRGQDFEYTSSIYKSGFKIFLIDAPLIEYNLDRSSFN